VSFSSLSSNFRAGIALGSNLGHSLLYLREAARSILSLSISSQTAVPHSSGVYRTAPIDCPLGSRYFLNAVVEIEWSSGPEALWDELRRLEILAGRKQYPYYRHAPRTLDLDLLYLGPHQGVFGSIVLPHPRIGSRRFVLVPLSDFAPHLLLLREKKTVLEQLALLPDSHSVERIEEALL
jgi:2-amino-4-hydroxy-6-hydroxymethyldihydropteridine diphosphokinase